jgi:LPS-assembly protein
MDLVNTGRESGLDTAASDYVGRLQVSPNKAMTFLTRARFDQEDFSVNRFEAGFTGSFAPLPFSGSVMYARYEAQPELGFDKRREGILSSAAYTVTPNWTLNGSVLVDLDKYLDAKAQYASLYNQYVAAGSIGKAPVYDPVPVWSITGTSVGVAYNDECTTLSVSYSMTPRQLANGTTESDRTLLVSLQLRSLGQSRLQQKYGPQTQDGLASR